MVYYREKNERINMFYYEAKGNKTRKRLEAKNSGAIERRVAREFRTLALASSFTQELYLRARFGLARDKLGYMLSVADAVKVDSTGKVIGEISDNHLLEIWDFLEMSKLERLNWTPRPVKGGRLRTSQCGVERRKSEIKQNVKLPIVIIPSDLGSKIRTGPKVAFPDSSLFFSKIHLHGLKYYRKMNMDELICEGVAKLWNFLFNEFCFNRGLEPRRTDIMNFSLKEIYETKFKYLLTKKIKHYWRADEDRVYLKTYINRKIPRFSLAERNMWRKRGRIIKTILPEVFKQRQLLDAQLRRIAAPYDTQKLDQFYWYTRNKFYELAARYAIILVKVADAFEEPRGLSVRFKKQLKNEKEKMYRICCWQIFLQRLGFENLKADAFCAFSRFHPYYTKSTFFEHKVVEHFFTKQETMFLCTTIDITNNKVRNEKIEKREYNKELKRVIHTDTMMEVYPDNGDYFANNQYSKPQGRYVGDPHSFDAYSFWLCQTYRSDLSSWDPASAPPKAVEPIPEEVYTEPVPDIKPIELASEEDVAISPFEDYCLQFPTIFKQEDWIERFEYWLADPDAINKFEDRTVTTEEFLKMEYLDQREWMSGFQGYLAEEGFSVD